MMLIIGALAALTLMTATARRMQPRANAVEGLTKAAALKGGSRLSTRQVSSS